MKNKLLLLSFGLIMSTQMIYSQNQIKRDPDSRKDYVNVFYKTQYTLFDLWSDEPIFPDGNKIYHIYYATNENKTPKEFNGTSYQLSTYTVYKFKNYENCKKWCDGVVFKSSSNQYSVTSSNTNTIKKSTSYVPDASDAILITAQLNSKNQKNDSSNFKEGEKCIEGDCIDRGTIQYSNGDTFKGKFLGLGVKSDGEYKWVNGDKYSGRFSKGNYEYGELKVGDITYIGSFLNNKYNGIGTLITDGVKYVGRFKEGKFYGYGIMYFANGDKYDGEWVAGVKQGQGKLTYISGKIEEGKWVNNQFISSNSISPKGNAEINNSHSIKKTKNQQSEFESDVKCIEGDCINGIGTIVMDEGKYVGGFKEGKFYGYGELYVKNSNATLKGDWNGSYMVGKVYSEDYVSPKIIFENGKFKSVNNLNMDYTSLMKIIFSDTVSSSSSSSQYNAYQCMGCAFISKGTSEPGGGAFNGCQTVNGNRTNHFWCKVNTNGKGQQCSNCGIKFYCNSTLVTYSFGGCKGNVHNAHYWSNF